MTSKATYVVTCYRSLKITEGVNFIQRVKCWNLSLEVSVMVKFKEVVVKWRRKSMLVIILNFSSVQFSCSVMSDFLRPHELLHARLPCPSPTPRVHSNSRPSGEGNGNPQQCSCLENPMDRGAWQATVHGVAKSLTQLSN